jgi:hypothetical protein
MVTYGCFSCVILCFCFLCAVLSQVQAHPRFAPLSRRLEVDSSPLPLSRTLLTNFLPVFRPPIGMFCVYMGNWINWIYYPIAQLDTGQTNRRNLTLSSSVRVHYSLCTILSLVMQMAPDTIRSGPLH